MENNIFIDFQQARDFSKKINTTFEFLRQNFKPLIKSLLFIAGPPMLVGSILAGSLYSDYFGFIGRMSRSAGDVNTPVDFLGSPVFWLEIIGAVLFLFLSGVMIISVVYNYLLAYQEQKSPVNDVTIIWDRVRATLPMYISTVFLFWLLLIAAYAVVLVIIIGAAALSPLLAFFAGVAIIIGLIYAIITLSLLFIIRANEQKGFFDALARAFYLIRDKWWSTFGLLFILGLIQSTIASLFLVPWYINFIISMMHSLDGSPIPETSVVSELINSLFMTFYFLTSFILYALPLIALAFQYFNLVERKEAKGLMARIETFGQATDTTRKDEGY
jgi:hypothetical protein